jgi:hypothetical protein
LVATGVAAFGSGARAASDVGRCEALAPGGDHRRELAELLADVRAGRAPEDLAGQVARGVCPFCGCGIRDPLTGRMFEGLSAPDRS